MKKKLTNKTDNKTLFAQIHCNSRDGLISRMDKEGDIEYLKEECRKVWVNANNPYYMVIKDIENKIIFESPARKV